MCEFNFPVGEFQREFFGFIKSLAEVNVILAVLNMKGINCTSSVINPFSNEYL